MSGPTFGPHGTRHRMVALTLLDCTTISLPARPQKRPSAPTLAAASEAGAADASGDRPSEPPSSLTARDLVAALRAVAGGAVDEVRAGAVAGGAVAGGAVAGGAVIGGAFCGEAGAPGTPGGSAVAGYVAADCAAPSAAARAAGDPGSGGAEA